jgi:peroxiredoxin
MIGAGIASSSYMSGVSSSHAATASSAIIPRAAPAGGQLSLSRVSSAFIPTCSAYHYDKVLKHATHAPMLNYPAMNK